MMKTLEAIITDLEKLRNGGKDRDQIKTEIEWVINDLKQIHLTHGLSLKLLGVTRTAKPD